MKYLKTFENVSVRVGQENLKNDAKYEIENMLKYNIL